MEMSSDPTDSCQLRRWRACEAALAARETSASKLRGGARWIAIAFASPRRRWRNAGDWISVIADRSLTGKTSPGSGRASGVSLHSVVGVPR
jgi:hypothetical protein